MIQGLFRENCFWVLHYLYNPGAKFGEKHVTYLGEHPGKSGTCLTDDIEAVYKWKTEKAAVEDLERLIEINKDMPDALAVFRHLRPRHVRVVPLWEEFWENPLRTLRGIWARLTGRITRTTHEANKW